jgi:hypothetical protein
MRIIKKLKMVKQGGSEYAVCPDCGQLMTFNLWDGAWWCFPGFGGCNLKARERYLFERLTKKNPNLAGRAPLYEQFHGNPPIRVRHMHYEPPKGSLIKLGTLSQINYRPEYPSQHQNTEFYHKAGDDGERILKSNLILATDQKGKNLYLLKIDPKSRYPHVTNRGIIG